MEGEWAVVEKERWRRRETADIGCGSVKRSRLLDSNGNEKKRVGKGFRG